MVKRCMSEEPDALIVVGFEPPCSPLMVAAWIGDAELVEFMHRECGADLDWKDSDDRTALLRACACGHYEVVEVLIRLGCNLNVADVYGHTPIGLASSFKFRKMQKLLAQHCKKNKSIVF